MTILYLFRVYAISPPGYEYIWSEDTPTTTQSGGSIDSNQTTIVDSKEVSDDSIDVSSNTFDASGNSTIYGDTSANPITVNLPDAVANPSKIYYIFNLTGTNNITVDPSGSQTIDSSSNAIIIPGGNLTIKSDGISNWSTNITSSNGVIYGPPTTDLSATTENSEGSQGSAARSDHTHAILTGTPSSIGSSNSTGSAASLARSDHIHQGVHSINANAGTARYGDITLQEGTNVTINDNGSGTLTFSAASSGSFSGSFALTGAFSLGRVTFSNAPYTVTSSNCYIAQTGTMSASRVVSLPAASGVNNGGFIIIADESGTVTSSNTLVVTRNGSDTIDGATTFVLNTAYGSVGLVSNGSDKWIVVCHGTISLTSNSLISGTLPIANGGTNSASSLTNGKLMVSSGGAIIEGTSSSAPSFSSVAATNTTNQIALGTTNVTTISAPAPSGNITLTLPNTADTLVGRATTDTLTNKTLTSPVISTIVNTGTLTLPTSTDTLVGRATTDTLTNKTLTAPVISSIVNTGTLTLPTSTDTLVGRATTDTLMNKSLNNTNVFHVDGSDNSKKIGYSTSGATTGTTLTLAGIQTTGRTITFPDTTDTVVTLAATQTLTNKTLTSPTINTPSLTVNDGSFTVQNTSDTTKKFNLSLASITTGTTRTLTVPDTNDTIVTLAATQTLTNKTLTTPVISTISNTGTLTLPTSTDTLIGRATTDTLTNKTLTAPVIATIVNTGTLTLPTSTDTLVGRATTDTLTNKSLNNTNVFFVDNADNTKKIGFSSSGATTGTTLTLAGIQTTGRTITFPDTTDTVTTLAATQTLTNKTFSTAVNITPVTNQLVLGTTNTTTVSAPAPASSITLTLPIRTATVRSEDNNVIRVEKGGNDTNGSRGGAPFLTLTAALAASGITSGDVIKIGPGTYSSETFPLTIPSGVIIIGDSTANCVISASAVTTNTTMFSMGTNSVIRNLTISMTSATASLTLKAITFTSTTAASAIVQDCNISISNTVSGAIGTINGVESSGTGVATADVVNLRGTIINISAASGTSGTARALVLNAANTIRARNCTLMCTGAAAVSCVAAETITSSSATFIGRNLQLRASTNCYLQTAGVMDLINVDLVQTTNGTTAIQNFGRVAFSATSGSTTLLTSDTYAAQTGTLSGTRTFTIPAAATMPVGSIITIADESGSVTSTNTITISRSSSDTIDNTTSVVMNLPYCFITLVSDGVSKWKQINGKTAYYSTVTAGAFTTSSTTAVTVTGATFTPGGGTYRADFTASIANNNTGPTGTVAVYVNGTQVADSVVQYKASTTNSPTPMSVFSVNSLADGDVIDIRAFTTANTLSISNRHFSITRL